MRILFNHVLVKPDPVDTIKLAGGFELFIDNRFEEQKNAPQSGIVVQLPERLIYNEDPEAESLNFDVDMELQVGDRIVFHYLAQDHALRTGAIIDGNILIRYDSIFVALRGEEVIPVNGTVLVVPESEIIKTNLIIPEHLSQKLKTFGTVLAAGTPHRAHRFRTKTPPPYPFFVRNGKFESIDHYCKAGDKVYFHHINAIPLQHNAEYHGIVKKALIYRMTHEDIELIVDQEVRLEEVRI